VLLVLTVGGAHNDTMLLAALAGALLLSAGASPRLRAAAGALVAGVGIKVTAGVALPFLVLAPARWRERARVAAGALGALAVLALVGVLGFGVHALGFVGALSEQQQLVATHSVPAELARLLGIGAPAHPPAWWRHLFLAGFAAALACALWRTARGADWRVAAGWATIALLLSTAWLLPWYAVWPLPLAAVGGDRRLRAAALVLCAYALLVHLPLADPLLSPARAQILTSSPVRVHGLGHRLELAGFQVLHDVHLDLRW
jgi:hypothetical protein